MHPEVWAEVGSWLVRVVVGIAAAALAAGPLLAQDKVPLQDTVSLDTIRVQVGSRASSELPVLTRSIQLFDRTDIDALPVRTVSGLLEWATAVEVMSRSPAQSDVSVRGGSFEQVVVLVNGVRMSDPQTGHFDLDLAVPLDRVLRVEILRGPASALYGADAMGGVVNVVTRDAGSPWRARAEGGSWGAARLSASGGVQRDGGLGIHAGGELSRSDGHRAGTDYDVLLGQLGLSHPLGAGTLSGELGLSRRDFGASGFYAPYPSFERTRTYTSAVRWTASPAGPLWLELGASYRRHDDDFILIRDDPSVYRNQHTSAQGGGEVLARSAPQSWLELVLGGELYQDALDSDNLGDRTEARGALFGEILLGRRGPGTLSLGLREDWHETFGAVFSPSLSAAYHTGPFRLRGALGRSFRAPTWTERYYVDPANVGRADLEPERAISGELGVDLRAGSRAHLALTAFARQSESLIDWARDAAADDTVPWETRNVEKAAFRGLEADIELTGPWQTDWNLGAIVLAVDAAEAEGYVSKYALRPLEERFTVGVRRSFGDHVRLSAHALRARRADEADPHHRLDLRSSLSLGALRVYLDATNLLDATYPDITGAPAPGRAVHLGITAGGRW